MKRFFITFCMAFSVKIHSYFIPPFNTILYTKYNNNAIIRSNDTKNVFINYFTDEVNPSFANIWIQHFMERDMTKIILNKCYGGFSFSDEFIDEFEKLYKSDFTELFYMGVYDPSKDKTHNNKHIHTRYDPRIIDLFEKMGGNSKCAGKYAQLEVLPIPTPLLKYMFIEEHNGYENVGFKISQMYKEILDNIIETRHIKLQDISSYKQVKLWEIYLQEHNIKYF